MKFARVAFAATGLVLAVDAHMFMATPTPIEGSAPKSPLLADGSNFPCHGITLPGSGGQSMPVGSKQLLSWDLGDGANTATHGGGSCQLSVTYETDPDKIKFPSAWKVIYSIEEGCPTNSPGNLDGSFTNTTGGTYSDAVSCTDPTSNGYDCVNQFEYTIPEGLQNGQATLAWTWFNVVGNREMYMNCAAVEISGGADSDSGMSALPEMFIANLDGTYGTTEDFNLQFPNPGKYITTKTASTRISVPSATNYPFKGPCSYDPSGAACPSAGTGSIGEYTGTATVVAATSGIATSAATTSAASTAAASSSSSSSSPSSSLIYSVPQASATSAISSSTSATSSAASSASSTGSVSGSNSTSSSGTSSSSTSTNGTSSASCASGYMACPSPGSTICSSDGTQFGSCDTDNCALLRDVSAGTKCVDGYMAFASPIKRSIRAHRHAAHGHKMFN